VAEDRNGPGSQKLTQLLRRSENHRRSIAGLVVSAISVSSKRTIVGSLSVIEAGSQIAVCDTGVSRRMHELQLANLRRPHRLIIKNRFKGKKPASLD
jgi:hypothetical protein